MAQLERRRHNAEAAKFFGRETGVRHRGELREKIFFNLTLHFFGTAITYFFI